MADNVIKTGTTTIGIKLADGVILATDRRASTGFAVDKGTRKLFKLSDNLGVTTAGAVGQLQVAVRFLQGHILEYNIKKGVPMTVSTAAVYTSRVIMGLEIGLIIGGYDNTGGHVFEVAGDGSSLEMDYMSVGSGSVFAFGVLDAQYRPGMTKEEGMRLAITALSSSIKRDLYSGDGMLMAYIGPDGYQEFSDEEIRSICASIGFSQYPN